jgi:hypothetical protein
VRPIQVTDLRAVFSFMGDGETVLPIEPPIGSAVRYLSSLEVQAGGSGIVRIPFQLHTRDPRDFHTVCTRHSRVGLSCGHCGYHVFDVEPVDALSTLVEHTGQHHPRRVPRYFVRELWPDDRTVERRFW